MEFRAPAPEHAQPLTAADLDTGTCAKTMLARSWDLTSGVADTLVLAGRARKYTGALPTLCQHQGDTRQTEAAIQHER